jgi:chromosomal replication initiator protein
VDNLELSALWSRTVGQLRDQIGNEQTDLWLKPTELISLENGILQLRVPNKFFSNWIKEHYQTQILEIVKKDADSISIVDYDIAKDLKNILPENDPIYEPNPQSDFRSSELNPKYTFSTFVVGTSNRFAHATAESIVKMPGTQYNPFVIYGGVGLGKTHLMHAMGHALRKERPSARVLYTTSEQFVNEYVECIRHNTTESFRTKYRNLDCLLMDDLQFLIAKERSEEEFFHTFNALFNAHKQLVISSDRSPKEMTPHEKRLISRLEWGVIADIKIPDIETRIAILRKKAELEGFFVPDDVTVFLSSAIKTNVRALEGALIRLKAFASATGHPLTIDYAKEILKDSLSSDSSSPIPIETIQRIVAYKYSIDVKDLKGHYRYASISIPRQIAMYLCCVMTDMSLKDIGRAFGGKDHTTVIHARDKMRKKVEEDPFFLEMINKLQSNIKALDRT